MSMSMSLAMFVFIIQRFSSFPFLSFPSLGLDYPYSTSFPFPSKHRASIPCAVALRFRLSPRKARQGKARQGAGAGFLPRTG
ncbi:uncharacterized protein B0J16DRAFT_335203, partial [Fusarium flagelliforme]|uniref:uncharacterized protein n=1 Tax=Fusarium flagelliforme TaxID=2675880 RepID=UPI001E8DC8A0